jgi:asparagine synthase (glutamine-hydrolysing)
MCGICGVIHKNGKTVERGDLNIMMDAIKHRGPDDSGTYINNNIGLGFVRLSILDLSYSGHQPMYSSDKRFIIIYNGEVYNYKEIRRQLSSKHTFVSGTDTEVVLAAYQEWGENCLEKFNGMFSFIIYDTRSKTLFAARDRFGIKPFYYFEDDERIVFASEIKAIHKIVKSYPNDKAIYDYLIHNRTDHTKQTFFSNIQRLSPAHLMIIDSNQNVSTKRWYNLRERVGTNQSMSSVQYLDLFNDSLRLRLRADVPIGVSLSGGLDSSAITSSLLDTFNLKNMNTFSAVYGKTEDSDESRYIDEYIPFIKNMHFSYPTSGTLIKDYRDFIIAHNEPVPDLGPYAQFKVMELAKKHVTVTIDGQGADEQLAGYHYFFGSYYVELFRSYKFHSLILENYHYFLNHGSLDALKYFLYYLFPNSIQSKIRSSTFPSVSPDFLLNSIGEKSKYDINAALYHPVSLGDSLIQHFEHKLEHLLRWEDLNGMYHSIESRVPFLDYRLVEATLSTPSSQKIKRGNTKVILRQAMKGLVPETIINRMDKKGFSNPRDKWFRTEKFQELIGDTINGTTFRNLGYFNVAKANEQYINHLSGRHDHSKEIWKWINMSVWHEELISC